MPQTAKVRNLQVLPSRSADLCFTTAGVIALQNYDHQNKTGIAYIGQPVNGFDFTTQLYAVLAETVTNIADPRYPGDPAARIKYDASEIHKSLTAPAGNAPFLFALRNESLAAILDQAIVRREGAYFQRFKHGTAIQQAMTLAFPDILSNLNQIKHDAEDRFTAVDNAHATSTNPVVITETATRNSVSGNYKVTTKTKQRNTLNVNGEFDAPDDKEMDTRVFEGVPDANSKAVQTHKSDRQAGFPYVFSGDAGHPVKFERLASAYLDDAQISDTTTAGDQIAKSEVPNFFHPRLDNSIAHRQQLSGLAIEKMNQTIASLSAGHMERIVVDERSAIDMEVRRLQVAFADTYMTSPISGIVTAVYKDVGEYVQPGEPVLRVENDSVVFLVGRVQFHGALRIGQPVTVHASDLFESQQAKDFPGKIRGIKGHEADDDEWEVLIECDNPLDGGQRVLPIYYQFDRDTTSIIIT